MPALFNNILSSSYLSSFAYFHFNSQFGSFIAHFLLCFTFLTIKLVFYPQFLFSLSCAWGHLGLSTTQGFSLIQNLLDHQSSNWTKNTKQFQSYIAKLDTNVYKLRQSSLRFNGHQLRLHSEKVKVVDLIPTLLFLAHSKRCCDSF